MSFLLAEPELAGRFRAFLRYVAEGGPYSPGLADGEMVAERATATLADDLAAFLGSGLDELDARFGRWIEADGGRTATTG